MADIKFFHKILIFVVILYVFSKLSKIKLPKFSWKKCQNQPSQPVTRCAPSQPPRREPEVRVITQYVQTPAPAPRAAPPVMPVAPATPQRYTAPRPAQATYYPPASGSGSGIPDDGFSGVISFSDDSSPETDFSDGYIRFSG